jgi:four helix bundle protein
MSSLDKNTSNFRELEQRTTDFAKRVVNLTKELPKGSTNRELSVQIVRSAGSVGANYREAMRH